MVVGAFASPFTLGISRSRKGMRKGVREDEGLEGLFGLGLTKRVVVVVVVVVVVGRVVMFYFILCFFFFVNCLESGAR